MHSKHTKHTEKCGDGFVFRFCCSTPEKGQKTCIEMINNNIVSNIVGSSNRYCGEQIPHAANLNGYIQIPSVYPLRSKYMQMMIW